MQEDYEADGWLGILLGVKKYIRMSTVELVEENITDLINELNEAFSRVEAKTKS